MIHFTTVNMMINIQYIESDNVKSEQDKYKNILFYNVINQ